MTERERVPDVGATMTASLEQEFVRLVSLRTGIRIGDQDREKLRSGLQQRMAQRHVSAPEQYLRLLEAPADDSAAEWDELIPFLTIGETYFFRDKGQFTLLQQTILPELIERRKGSRLLRLWSAGCGTGEEAYSLAMLVEELLGGEGAGWIMGTDINPHALRRAAAARYSEWSLRMVEPALLQRYFHRDSGGWALDDRIRQLVKFRSGNLVHEPFPTATPELRDLDVILCRNVFLHFDPLAIGPVVQKFAAALSPVGYLMTGHGELQSDMAGPLCATIFPESVVYQRRAAVPEPGERARPPAAGAGLQVPMQPAPSAPVEAAAVLARSSMPPSPAAGFLLAEARACLHRGDYPGAIERARRRLDQDPRNVEALCLLAHAHANLGRHEPAARCCREAIDADPSAASPHYLLAHIEEEQGHIEEAMALLHTTLSLDPSFVAARLNLAALCRLRGDKARARQLCLGALALLDERLPAAAPGTGAAADGERTSEDLRRSVHAMLEGLSE